MHSIVGRIVLSRLDTTRSPRPGEQNGRGRHLLALLRGVALTRESSEYHFVSRPDMEAMIANGEFLEKTEFSANLYGTR